MIDLSIASEGDIGPGAWFSDLYIQAVQSNLTGGVLVQAQGGDAAVFFREGRPVHAAGSGFRSHFLGSILVERGACTQAQVDAAAAKQQTSGEPALLGALLVSDAGVSPADVKRAIQAQNDARFRALFALTEGRWRAAPGENARIRDIGVVTPAWSIFFRGLEESASDAELRSLADRLLGRAVQLKGGTLGVPDFEPSPSEKKLLQYLDKPRKPDQLERALKSRRLVRGFLRSLDLLGRLVEQPVGKAIAIPKATLLKGVDLPGAEQARAVIEAKRRAEAEASRPTPPPSRSRAPSTPAVARRAAPIVREVEEFHETMEDKSFFELLGVDQHTPPADLRKRFTQLAKKYHPDAFPSDASAEIAGKAREISAKINEAYQTLSHETKRAEYLALLADKRIKGDLKRVDKVRDAEVKSKMGLVLVKKREFRKAQEMFERAMDLDPQTAEYKAHYAWTVFVDPKADRQEAVAAAAPLVQEALQKTPDNPLIHFYMGQIEKARKNDKQALSHFKKVVRLDPKHADAQREVRLLEMRRQKGGDDKGSGRLSKLFKRS